MNILEVRFGSRDWQQLTIFNGNLKRPVRLKHLEEFNEWKKDINYYNKIKGRQKTLQKHVEMNNLIFYVTFTINPHWHCSDDAGYKKLIHSMQTMLKRKNVKYFLVPERHENGSWHFHGFIEDNPYMKITEHKDKHGNRVFHFLPFQENYGFTSCVLIPDNKKAKTKMIRYTIKYTLKESSKRSLHSRIITKTKENAQ